MNKRMKAVLLAAVLVLSMVSSAALAVTTEAKVAFVDGVLEFGQLQGSDGMNMDFGSHTLPLGAVSYTAEDGEHQLTVLDAKSTNDTWSVTAKMTGFSSGTVSNVFDGTIHLQAGSSNAAAMVVQDPIELTSDQVDVLVTKGTDTATGSFVSTWQQQNIKLDIDAANATTINTPASYVATITWTLTTMP